MDYLGFEVSSQGVYASPDKVRAVVEWPHLKDIHDVRLFLGLALYYKKFIHGFSEIVRPLTDLTCAAKESDWKELRDVSCSNGCKGLYYICGIRLKSQQRHRILP